MTINDLLLICILNCIVVFYKYNKSSYSKLSLTIYLKYMSMKYNQA